LSTGVVIGGKVDYGLIAMGRCKGIAALLALLVVAGCAPTAAPPAPAPTPSASVPQDSKSVGGGGEGGGGGY
jgi:hypothetical protein